MNDYRHPIRSRNKTVKPKPLHPEKAPTGCNEERGLKSVPVPRGQARSANHRDDDRYRLDGVEAVLVVDGERVAATVVNLSGGGAMIEAAIEPQVHQPVGLELDGSALDCSVLWVRGSRIGLEFAHETGIDASAEERDALLLEVLRRTYPNLVAYPAAPADKTPAFDDHNRADRRHPLIWTGEIHYNHASRPVRLRNISSSGALVEGASRYPIGADVLLDLGEAGTIFAVVSWVQGDQAGLQFQEQFELKRLADAHPMVAPHHWDPPEYLRVALAGEGASPWAPYWDRLSIEELKEELEGFMKR